MKQKKEKKNLRKRGNNFKNYFPFLDCSILKRKKCGAVNRIWTCGHSVNSRELYRWAMTATNCVLFAFDFLLKSFCLLCYLLFTHSIHKNSQIFFCLFNLFWRFNSYGKLFVNHVLSIDKLQKWLKQVSGDS